MLGIIKNYERDIHIRFEDNIFNDSPSSFGVVMNKLTVVTTNELWAPQFIDRTEPANRNTPVYKHLKLEGFVVYWNPSGAIIASNLEDPKEIESKMAECLKEVIKENYILKPCMY